MLVLLHMYISKDIHRDREDNIQRVRDGEGEKQSGGKERDRER